MGQPNHYGRDVARCCDAHMRGLWPQVAAGLPDDQSFGGPLTTTFLLAMAIPIILIPAERLLQPSRGRSRGADDRALDPKLAAELTDVFGPHRAFGEAPFVERGLWRLATSTKFNISDPWPYELFERLRTFDAQRAADEERAERCH